jgi:mannose-6-phosphate isomerase
MEFQKGIYQLEGFFQHYAWGGKLFISSIARLPEGEKRPVAEYWLGAHPLGSSTVIDGGNSIALDQLIGRDPLKYLGKQVAERFGRLPYLLKILDVSTMLSIQVHPSKAAAEKEFVRENQEGIPLHAPERNYKDDNHKPELMVALGEFWLLHGFKPEEQLKEILGRVNELKVLKQWFEQDGYKGLYKTIMEMPQAEVNKLLQPLLDRILPLYQENKLQKDQEDFWAARAALTFPSSMGIDRGIFSIYLFNLMKLKKGEAVFQDAGVPHAYLEGQNVEIMANSDNVLRGGLTTKHIDVHELLKHVKCQPTVAKILTGELIHGQEKVYKTTAPDFELSVFELNINEAVSFRANTTEIFLLTEGMVKIDAEGPELETGKPSAVVFAGITGRMICSTRPTTVFKASVPIHKGE